MELWLILNYLILTVISIENARWFQPIQDTEILHLTPYLESNRIFDAREKALVKLTQQLQGIISYAGFFTVNKTANANMFFWYFPAINASREAPVMLWLQGGPGVSGINGLLYENGPIQVVNQRFVRREVNWAVTHHMIYVDNPVGTGFSYTDPGTYCTNEAQIGEALYAAVTQFMTLFPELRDNNFFVSGESYAGKYVPAVARTIHRKNPTAKLKINLKGLAIGNGIVDPVNQISYGPYLYQTGLIDDNGLAVLEKYQKRITDAISEKEWVKALEIMNNVMKTDEHSLLRNLTGIKRLYNFLDKANDGREDFRPLLNSADVRMALHVGREEFKNGTVVQDFLKADIMQSIAPSLEELLEHYPVLMFNGQLDIILGYRMTAGYLAKLKYAGDKDYAKAKRYIWHVGDDVAGYLKNVGNLTELMVRNAGHMVPTDQPNWALQMITNFTHEKPFNVTEVII